MNQGQEILDFLFAKKDEMVDFLGRLILAESPSSVPNSQAQILSILFEALLELDFDTRLVAGHNTGGYLFACPRKSGIRHPSQLVLGHCDTVWPLGTLKNMPFSVEDNIVKGPGVYDMKGGLTQMVFALRALLALQLKPVVAPWVLVNSDEEIGSVESSPCIEQLAKEVDRVFVLEPSFGPTGKLKTARKGVGQFEVVVKGRAAHAGLEPEKGISAILELSHLIQKLFAMNDVQRGINVNVGTIEGGLRPNVIAPRSSAVVDVRVPTMDDAKKIEFDILNLEPVTPGIALEIKGQISRPPLERTPANRQLWKMAKDLAHTINLTLEEVMAGGGSDGNTTSQYTATLDGLGSVGDGAHADHEFIYIDKMIERTALLALLLNAPVIS